MARPRKQCKRCPWRVDVDPSDIPNGYCPMKHAALKDTIAQPGSLEGVADPLRIMACHGTQIGCELPCVGWMVHQMGPGNNIGFRLAVSRGIVDANVDVVGEQHPNLEATLPDDRKDARQKKYGPSG